MLGLLMAKFFYTCNFHTITSNRSHLPLSRNTLRKNALRADALRADASHERLPVRLDAAQLGGDDDDDDDEEEVGAY